MEPLRLDDASLPAFLRGCGVLRADEPATVEPAGDGNINWVRRVRTPARSVVVKQARPALERFPEYEAPTERIVCEARYYEIARALDVDRVCPAVLHFDAPHRVLVLEDLGDAPRLAASDVGAAARVARFLAAVHGATAGDASLAARFPNDGMRRLHGDHIFVLPFQPNDFPLAPAVRARVESIWRDGAVAAQATALYERYLAPHGALVHADVQPGNVLVATRGAVLLDAEIAHVGDPAFDLGTLLAHLRLPAVALGEPRTAEPAIDAVRRAYGGSADFEASAERYAAIEMLRRTLGAARVAAVADADAALRVVDFATGRL